MRQSQRFTNKNHYDENAALTYTGNNPSIANSTRIFSMKIAIDDGVLKETSNFNGEEGDFPKLRNRRIDSSLSCPELQKQIQRNLECIRLKTVGHFQYFELINCEVKEEKPTKIRLKTVASIPKDEPERAASKFLEEERAICVIRGQKNPIQRNMFPKRIRGSSCYLCGNRSGDDLLKCGANGCSVRFHKNCAVQSFVGGYTFSFMNRSGKFFCSMHHCTACFADHNRSRCFSGQFVSCDQCELAWHLECIPGGCEVDNKNTITCPRHVLFQDSLVCHVRHCADCQKEPEPDEKLINCTKCFRAMHHSCYIQTKLGPPENEEQNLEVATCHWCDMFDFVRVGEFAMARFSRQKWYPCQVVSNSEFILPKDPFLGSVGYVCVKWLPYKNKIFYNLVSHNRVIGMSVDDFFYATEAKKSDIYEEWTEAQQLTLLNGPRYRELKPYQIPSVSESNGEKMIRKVNRNKYSRPELKTPRDRLFQADLCKCASRSSDRCGPTSDCINRMLRLECPKECGEAPNAGCNNRSISEGNNCIPVSIEYFSGKGYGAIALQDVPQGGFVGEYVGEIVDKEEKKRRIERIASRQSNEAQYYIMELDENRAIDAQFYGNDMRYVNHSCNPNCVIQQIQSDNDIHLVLIANRRIKKGEELSFDYNMQGSGREVPICHCKEANCTKKLSANCVYKRKRYDWEEKAMSTTVVCDSNAGAAKDDKRCPSFPIVKRPVGRPKKAVKEKPTAEETVPKPMKKSRHH